MNPGLSSATDIADLILEVLRFNKVPGGPVVSLDLLGMDGVAVELDNGRKYEIRVTRTNPSDVE